jgi:hypothetical protein
LYLRFASLCFAQRGASLRSPLRFDSLTAALRFASLDEWSDASLRSMMDRWLVCDLAVVFFFTSYVLVLTQYYSIFEYSFDIISDNMPDKNMFIQVVYFSCKMKKIYF